MEPQSYAGPSDTSNPRIDQELPGGDVSKSANDVDVPRDLEDFSSSGLDAVILFPKVC